jgi:hypothetical protein
MKVSGGTHHNLPGTNKRSLHKITQRQLLLAQLTNSAWPSLLLFGRKLCQDNELSMIRKSRKAAIMLIWSLLLIRISLSHGP